MRGSGAAAGWGIYHLRPGHAAVVPESDLVGHNEMADDTDRCICGPTVVPVAREDGSNGWLYVHHSSDGREALERAGAT